MIPPKVPLKCPLKRVYPAHIPPAFAGGIPLHMGGPWSLQMRGGPLNGCRADIPLLWWGGTPIWGAADIAVVVVLALGGLGRRSWGGVAAAAYRPSPSRQAG